MQATLVKKRSSRRKTTENPAPADTTVTKCSSKPNSKNFCEKVKIDSGLSESLAHFGTQKAETPTVVRHEDVEEVVPESAPESSMEVRMSLPPGPRPLLRSEKDPSLRGRNWKPPTEPEDWRPTWKPRRKPILGESNPNVQKIVREIEDRLMMESGEFSKIPVGPDGVLVPSRELFTAIIWWVEQGGTLARFAEAVGAPRPTLQAWINQRPDVKARYKEAEARSADALVERAQEMAQTPFVVEETYLSYDGTGKLIRKDVSRRDAVLARKLFVQNAQWLASKRAPEKYGEKVEVKTDDAMAVNIVAARRRLMGGDR